MILKVQVTSFLIFYITTGLVKIKRIFREWRQNLNSISTYERPQAIFLANGVENIICWGSYDCKLLILGIPTQPVQSVQDSKTQPIVKLTGRVILLKGQYQQQAYSSNISITYRAMHKLTNYGSHHHFTYDLTADVTRPFISRMVGHQMLSSLQVSGRLMEPHLCCLEVAFLLQVHDYQYINIHKSTDMTY